MRCRVRFPFLLAALAVLVLTLPAVAQDWAHWRGPNHDGLSPETGFKTDWQSTPPLLWKADIGPAFSAVVCVGQRVYTCGTLDNHQVLLCLDADSGKILWQTPFEEEYQDRSGGDGTRATPTVHDGRVYILSSGGRLLCCDAQSGKELWSRKFDAPPRWGCAGSVLIEGDLAIVSAGGKHGTLHAVNRKTGKTVWQCGDGLAGYATPYPFTLEGRRYIVGFMGKQAVIAEAQTGRQVWNMPWQTEYDVNAASPIFHGGHLFLSSGYEHGCIVLRLAPSGNQLAAETVWGGSNIRAKFQSPVLYQGHLYTSDEVGLKCVEFATGTVKWSKRGTKHGTVVIADGHLLVLTESGQLLIAPATPAGFNPTTSVRLLNGRCWTVPTLHNGRLYVRNLKQAACYKLKP